MPDVKEQVNRASLAFVEHDLKFEHKDDYDKPVITLDFGGGDFSYTHVSIHIVFDLEGNSAQVGTSAIAKVPHEKTVKMLTVLNECNNKFRWAKFYLDDDNDVVANTDLVFDEINVGDVCVEIVRRMASIIDDAYADIMKSLWADN